MVLLSRTTATLSSRPSHRYASLGILFVLALLVFNHVKLFTGGLWTNFHPSRLLMTGQGDLTIVVLETEGIRDEVSASFFGAFGRMENVVVHAFLEKRRFEIERIYDQLPGKNQRFINDMEHLTSERVTSLQPDLILTISSEHDLGDDKTKKVLGDVFSKTHASLFSVVHDSQHLQSGSSLLTLRQWMKAGRLRILTLSAHVTHAVQDLVMNKGWSKHAEVNTVIVSTFPPVFDLPSLRSAREDEVKKALAATQHLTTQENSMQRPELDRDNKTTVQKFVSLLGYGEQPSPFELYMLGNSSATDDDPTQVGDNAEPKDTLPYLDFYTILQSATALLPAFTDETYLRNKASSTVPASLIAGAPLIANRELLAAYSYLDEDDVYLREDGEEEIESISRIARLPEQERREKSEALARKNEKLAREAAESMARWIEEALEATHPEYRDRRQRIGGGAALSPLVLFSYELPPI